jgi:hypothetical protein
VCVRDRGTDRNPSSRSRAESDPVVRRPIRHPGVERPVHGQAKYTTPASHLGLGSIQKLFGFKKRSRHVNYMPPTIPTVHAYGVHQWNTSWCQTSGQHRTTAKVSNLSAVIVFKLLIRPHTLHAQRRSVAKEVTYKKCFLYTNAAAGKVGTVFLLTLFYPDVGCLCTGITPTQNKLTHDK